MALTKGPLFSLEASGTIGNAVVFSRWKGRSYARRHAVPSNPKSVGQVSVRAAMKFLSQLWTSLSPTEQATWEERADAVNVSPFNAYCSYNLFSHRNFLGVTVEFPPALVSTPPTAPTLVLTGGVRSIQIEITPVSSYQDLGFRVHRSDSAVFTPVWNNCIGFVHQEAPDPIDYVDTPLAPGNYYYQVVGLMKDQIIGSYSIEGDETAT